ncbi:MAG TPA: ribosome-associated translation inhibitor RaiA [Lacunisphaera sp.]|jgi:putative sigma-54 modulation protein
MLKTENTPEVVASRVIIRGIHLHLSPALHEVALEKAARLLRHDNSIIRIRLDFERIRSSETDQQFGAKGHLEIGGPDLVATVASDDAYKSLDLLVAKLDELLRRRHQKRVNTRNYPQ